MEEVLQRLLGVLDKLTEERGVPGGASSVDKNILTSPNSTLDNGKKSSGNISTNEKKRLKETFSLFNKMFFDYKKKEEPDAKEKAKLTEISKKQATPPKLPAGAGKSGFGSMIGGLLLLVGGLAAFVTGIMSNGPFKGILKLLSKVGLQGGLSVIKKAIKPFIEGAMKLLKFPLKVLGKIGKFLGAGFSKIGKFALEGLEKLGGKTIGKVMGKLGSGGFMKMVGGFLGKFAKVFKRIPIIGTFISLAFAYSRFSSGDVVGGTIDVLSGLAGLLDIAAPGLGTTLSIGLDILNAVLDSKADNGPGKPKTSKLDILKDMASSIGTWIWDRREYIPVLSSINRFMEAWKSFKGGDISDGLANLGWGLASFLTGADAEKVLTGFGAFMGFFESTPNAEGEAPKANSSFLKDIASLIGEKLKGLWKWMTDTIKEGIIKFVPGGEKILEFTKDFVDETKAVVGKAKDRAVEFGKDFVSESKSILGKVTDKVGEFTKDFVSEAKNATSKVWGKVTTVAGGLVDSAKKMMNGAKESVGEMYESTKEALTPKDKNMDPLSLLGKSMLGMLNVVDKVMPKAEGMADPNTPTNKVSGSTEVPTTASNMLSKNTEDKKNMMDMLYQATLTSNQILIQIANNTARSITNSGGGHTSQTIVAPTPAPQAPTPLMTMPNNRGSYRSSPYAI